MSINRERLAGLVAVLALLAPVVLPGSAAAAPPVAQAPGRQVARAPGSQAALVAAPPAALAAGSQTVAAPVPVGSWLGAAPGALGATTVGTGVVGAGTAGTADGNAGTGSAGDSVAPPRVKASSMVLADEETGQVLFERAERQPRAMASTTKVMTGLLALEQLDERRTVVIGREPTAVGEESLELHEGERLTVHQLLRVGGRRQDRLHQRRQALPGGLGQPRRAPAGGGGPRIPGRLRRRPCAVRVRVHRLRLGAAGAAGPGGHPGGDRPDRRLSGDRRCRRPGPAGPARRTGAGAADANPRGAERPRGHRRRHRLHHRRRGLLHRLHRRRRHPERRARERRDADRLDPGGRAAPGTTAARAAGLRAGERQRHTRGRGGQRPSGGRGSRQRRLRRARGRLDAGGGDPAVVERGGGAGPARLGPGGDRPVPAPGLAVSPNPDRGPADGGDLSAVRVVGNPGPGAAAVWTLLDGPTLRARVAQLGARLRADYQGLEPIMVSVLRGAVVFLADLVRVAEMPCKVDFMAVERSDASETTGVVRILKDLELDVTGHHVLLVEDVVDTGLTLAYLLEVLEARRPASLCVCALLDKRARRRIDVPLAYVGFEVPDTFVFGYGLDLDERERGRDEVLATADLQALRRDPRLIPVRGR